MKSRHTIAWVVLAGLMLSACGPLPHRPPEDKAPVEEPVDPTAQHAGLSKEERLARMNELRADKSIHFTFGKGDILSISVYNEPDLTVDGVPVRPDGKISYPLIGDVQAEGLTVEELRAELTKKLSKYVKAPKVSVIVQQFTSLEYTLVGEVVHPGVYPLHTNVTLTKAIAKAGGLLKGQFHASSVEIADLTHAFIQRNGEVLPVDFVALLRQGDLQYDIPLKPGDYIFIPSGLSKEIYVLGEVARPDLFAFRDEMSLSKALAFAKGFTPDADTSRIHVVRGSLTNPDLYVVNLDHIMKGKVRDITLHPGDIVYVPPTGLTTWARTISKITTLMSGYKAQLDIRKARIDLRTTTTTTTTTTQ
jgi:polysaccharide export outer membrane protein